jgi:hypothetical protein
LAALRRVPGLPTHPSIRCRADHQGWRLSKALKFIGAFK